MKQFKTLIMIVISLVTIQCDLMGQFCVSPDILRELIDTNKTYVLKSHIKVGSSVQKATLAVANNLKVLQVNSDAAIVKFKFAGFHPIHPTIPQYYVLMTGSLYLTRVNVLTGEVLASIFSNQQNQKWVLRKNSNDTYSILGDNDGNGISCWALGRLLSTDNSNLVLNSSIKTSGAYTVGNVYQQFWITSLQ